MTPVQSSANLKFGGLEVARGVAAILVAAYHGSRLIAEPRYTGTAPANGLFGDFNFGVDFFFVLSGFLITWVHWRDIGQPSRLGRYAIRRLTRIYPAYWLVLFPWLIARLFGVGSTVTAPPGPLTIFCSIFLLPSPLPPVLGVAWSLIYEMFFYLLFGLAMLAGWRSMFVAMIWAGAIVIANLVSAPDTFPAAFFLQAYNLEFLFGVGVACVLRSVNIPAARLVASVGALLFLGLMFGRIERLVGANEVVLRLLVGLAASMIVLGTVELERSHHVRIPVWLAQLGAASYAIYLVHSIVEPIALIVVWHRIASLSPTLITIGLMCTGTLAGILFHLFAEKPVMLRVRRAVAGPAKPVLA